MDYSAYLVPLLLAFTSLFAMGKRVNVYDALTRGAEEGLTVLLRILPALVGLMTAVYMLRASGAMDALGSLLAPVLVRLGIPPETAALLFIRPISGSGALAIGSELMAAHGPDSYVGRVAAVMLGSTETTFYTVAVYFGAAGIRKTRYAIPAALIADLTGFMAAALAVRLLFGEQEAFLRHMAPLTGTAPEAGKTARGGCSTTAGFPAPQRGGGAESPTPGTAG